jgi:hypothetical protein
MMHGDDDGVRVGLDLSLPPVECLAGHHAARIAAEVASADGLRGFVDVAHHQEQQVADTEAVAFPGPFDREGAFVVMHAGVPGVGARRVVSGCAIPSVSAAQSALFAMPATKCTK